MGDSLDHERPAKRIKLAPHQASSRSSHQQPVFVPPPAPDGMAMPTYTTYTMASLDTMPPAAGPWAAAVGAASAFAAPWPPPPVFAVALGPTPDDGHVAWAAATAPATAAATAPVCSGPAPVFTDPTASVSAASTAAAIAAATAATALDPLPATAIAIDTAIAPSISSAPPPAEFDPPPTNHTSNSIPPPHRFQQSHSSRLPSGTITDPTSDSHSHDQPRRRIRSKPPFVSPFKDCLDTFGKYNTPRFPRPPDGKVNGYIKFHWPERRAPSASSSSMSVVTECNDDEDDDDDDELESTQSSSTASHPSSVLALAHPSSSSSSPGSAVSTTTFPRSPVDGNFTVSFTSSTPPYLQSNTPFPLSYTDSNELVPARRSSIGGPRMVPPQFGLLAKMDHMDRQFWTFYIMNWCPGRSVLGKTNLWLKDFAKMHESPGVRAAIQSLAGIYIYDYQPMDAIRKRTNHRFSVAESRLSHLLSDPANLDDDEASELVTIASILSMQDIVLTERRREKPQNPRWLQGFRQSEHFLEVTDRGSRFWLKTNVQMSSLRISQSIIVGRAVILAQPMMPLPAPSTFDPEQEAARFGWLLYGTQQDMYEIHGGCGFSKKLLHVISQITYCAARLQQDCESPVVPLTVRYLFGELLDMRQWSSESRDWEDAKSGPQTIEWVRAVPEHYILDSSPAMTDVTAEAWRLAAIVYLQCRAMRLPRNHPEVLANLTDLAKCIRIMPTSGTHFTAQAPLFPVFLLGMLATAPGHLEVSKIWFDKVVDTPVRSSVPPLYDALLNVRTWINTEADLTPSPDCKISENIANRRPWWELLVQRVQEREKEVLCLT